MLENIVNGRLERPTAFAISVRLKSFDASARMAVRSSLESERPRPIRNQIATLLNDVERKRG